MLPFGVKFLLGWNFGNAPTTGNRQLVNASFAFPTFLAFYP
jgi:hypothetical protein